MKLYLSISLFTQEKLEAFLEVLGLHLGKSNWMWIYKESTSVACSACPRFSFPAHSQTSSSPSALTTEQKGDSRGLQRRMKWRGEIHEHQETHESIKHQHLLKPSSK